MSELLKKRIEARIYRFKVLVKAIIYRNRNFVLRSNPIGDILNTYKNKERIVIVASGPSANAINLNKGYLYLTSNTGNRIVEEYDFLYYLNDNFYINRALAGSFLRPGQEILFFYTNTGLHKTGLGYLLKYLMLLGDKKMYFISENIKDVDAIDNFKDFQKFYNERNLPVRVRNSGVFLLLFGFYLAHQMSLPVDIYGLDLGMGGNVHFDKKAVVGKSVTSDKVKIDVKMYLDHIYANCVDVKNYSNFYGNMTGLITQ